MQKNKQKNTLIKAKIVFDRGRSYLGYFTFLMMVFVTVTSMKRYTYFQRISGWYWIAAILVATIAIIFLIGYLEVVKLKVLQKEQEIYYRMNPVMKEILENQKKILKKIGRK